MPSGWKNEKMESTSKPHSPNLLHFRPEGSLNSAVIGCSHAIIAGTTIRTAPPAVATTTTTYVLSVSLDLESAPIGDVLQGYKGLVSVSYSYSGWKKSKLGRSKWQKQQPPPTFPWLFSSPVNSYEPHK